uniref:Uncharacterized protein n=1 Tax=Rhizophora mucronata TaxID=61149 RepID=A0A2P2KLE8_RHIMU
MQPFDGKAIKKPFFFISFLSSFSPWLCFLENKKRQEMGQCQSKIRTATS